MNGINDTRGINEKKLKHIFLGEVKSKNIKGYHCNIDIDNDTMVKTFGKMKYSSNGIRRYNPNQCIFEAKVRAKNKFDCNIKKSTFFSSCLSRQQVVNLIFRINTNGERLKSFTNNNVYRDKKTGLVVVDCSKTTYPLTRL